MGTHAADQSSTRPLAGAGSTRPGKVTGVVAAFVLLLACALLVGCGPDEATSQASTSGAGDGAALYDANCASCHGADLRGTAKGPSHLSIVYEPNHHGDEAFRSAIAVGAAQHHWNFGDMPPVPGLDEDEVDQIIAYVRSVQEQEGFER